MGKQTIDITKSARDNATSINNNFNELYQGAGGAGGNSGVTTVNNGLDIRDGGEYIECLYDVTDISAPTELCNGSYGVTGSTMIVDGVETPRSSSHQFQTLGFHVVLFTPKSTTLAAWSFNNIKSLVSVRLPSAMTTVADRAFNGASRLKMIAMGASLTVTTGIPFSQLWHLVLTSETPPASVIGLDSNSLTIAHVKASALAAYIADTNWSVYADRITDEPLSSEYNKLYNGKGEKLDTNPLFGKTFVTLGDSFTASSSGSNTWPRFMCRELGAKLLANYANGGHKWSENTRGQAQSLVNSGYRPDYILIFLGVNDRGMSADANFGEITYQRGMVEAFDNAETHTFTMGVQATLELLQRELPDSSIKIGWTPNGSQFTGSGDMSKFINRLKELAVLYGVEYIETRCCGMSTLASSGVYFAEASSTPSPTGSYHPSLAGHIKIGLTMAKTMLCHL